MEHPTQKSKPDDPLWPIYLVCSVHATAITPFIRSGFGSEALGLHGVLAFLLILFVGTHQGSKGMMVYLMVWLCFMAYRRFETMRRRHQGILTHSRYAGYPWLAMKVPFVRKESTAKGIIEPELCAVLGALIGQLSETTGIFVIAGFFSILIREGIERGIAEKRAQKMIDAKLEGEYYSGRLAGKWD